LRATIFIIYSSGGSGAGVGTVNVFSQSPQPYTTPQNVPVYLMVLCP
jgi:hypothetical protein